MIADVQIETNSNMFQNLLCITFVNKCYVSSKLIQIFYKCNLKLFQRLLCIFGHNPVPTVQTHMPHRMQEDQACSKPVV